MYSHTLGIEFDKPELWVRQVHATDCIRIDLDSVPTLCDRMLKMAGYNSPELSKMVLCANRESPPQESYKGWK